MAAIKIFQLEGWINEKLGRHVNKAMLLKFAGYSQTTVYKIGTDGLPEYETKNVTKQAKLDNGQIVNVDVPEKTPVMEEKKFKRYVVIRQIYFKNSEITWKIKLDGQEHAYLLNVINTAYQRGSVNVQFIDAETGNGVNMSGVVLIPTEYEPKKLSIAMQTKHLSTFINQNKQQIAWAFLAIGVVLGVFIGFVISGYIPKNVPTEALLPTPLPTIIPSG